MEQILEQPKLELRTAQRLFLDKVEESRKQGNTKGLLIFATGLGKTLASLSDALRVAGDKGKILVLAHNHNLLYQHAKDFKLLNQTKKIGFLYKSKKEVGAEVLFANIMTIRQKKYLSSFRPEEFDYIIIDETHHAGAVSYKRIFEYFKPKFLLGMTATPNRTDQIDIMPLYDNKIIVNIDAYEAINRGWLRPFKYLFLWDKWCNYDEIKSYRTKEGHCKYDVKELGKAYFVSERDEAIIKEFKEKAQNRKGIGFCVSVDEAIRMAQLFNENGIRSVAIWGGSKKGRTMKEEKRNKILEDFSNGEYQMLFNCEIIGEGLHLPSVDVVLKLRPTMSKIKDNQHNGRGLYNIEGLKNISNYDKLLIIDFVGNYNKGFENYIYQGKQITKSSNKARDIREIVQLPIGCEVEFEERVINEFNRQMNGEKINITSEDLIRLHHVEKRSCKEIARIFGCGVDTIYGRMNQYGIKILKGIGTMEKHPPTKDLLIKQYFEIKKRINRKPNSLDINRKNGRYGLWWYEKLYGSFNNFLKENNEKFQRRYNDKELMEHLFELKNKKGRIPRTTDLEKASYSLYEERFGKKWIDLMTDFFGERYSVKDAKKHKTFICKVCGMSFDRPSYKEWITCSRQCQYKWQHIKKINRLESIFPLAKEIYRKKGMSLSGVAKELDTNKDLIKELFISKDIPIKSCSTIASEKYHFIPESKKEYLIKQYLKGTSLHNLSKRSNFSYKSIRELIKSKSIRIRMGVESPANNINIITKYTPKTLIIPTKQKQKGKGKTYEGLHKEQFKSKEDKMDIRDKIISKIKDGDNVLLLESPDLSALKEIEKKGIKPRKIVIPNHLEFKRLAEELRNYKTTLNIECINTSALQYLIDSEEKFDFIWLDYCGAFSYYMKDLDILFAKHFGEMKLILTYNLFDPAKDDENYYFTRVIDYVLDKISGESKIRLLNDITYRYKKNMYNIGFDIQNRYRIDEVNVGDKL